VVREDGRNVLLATRSTWDLVIGDIFLTYRAGVGALYTREHFAAVSARLAPDGIFAQWLTMFDLSEEDFGTIARTLLDVFPQVTLWRRSVSPEFPVYALVARKSPAPLELDGLVSRLARLKEGERLPGDVWLQNSPLAAYAGNISAAAPLFAGYPVSTDDRCALEYSAPRTERNSKGAGTTPALAWDELARFCGRLLEETPPSEDPYLVRVDPDTRRQVPAGLAYYRYVTFQRRGRTVEAERALVEYRELIATR
jgi:spermidine synthase